VKRAAPRKPSAERGAQAQRRLVPSTRQRQPNTPSRSARREVEQSIAIAIDEFIEKMRANVKAASACGHER
jgi:hypothetical protein